MLVIDRKQKCLEILSTDLFIYLCVEELYDNIKNKCVQFLMEHCYILKYFDGIYLSFYCMYLHINNLHKIIFISVFCIVAILHWDGNNVCCCEEKQTPGINYFICLYIDMKKD